MTATQISPIFGNAAVDALGASLDVPVITGLPQAQGDIMIRTAQAVAAQYKTTVEDLKATTPLSGSEVILEGRGGNAHILFGPNGDLLFDRREGQIMTNGVLIGVLTVPQGSVAYLDHVEHGRSAIGAGDYTISRQVETLAAATLVAD